MRNVYNSPSYGVVGNSVCRMWESCPLAFPCSVNRVIHDGMGSYAHFHGAFLALNRRFSALFTGQGCYSCLALLVCLSAALSALNTG